MARQVWKILATGLAWAPLLGCNSVLGLDITYRECVEPEGKRYVESFEGEGLQSLRDRCWRVANPGPDPAAIEKKIFVEDGDLVMRVFDSADPKDLDQWSTDDQAPFLHRSVESDFLIVARAEASTKSNGDHCLPAGNAAGLAVRRPDAPGEWATWTVEPHLWVNGTKQAVCIDDTDDTNNPTATARLRSFNPTWAQADFENIGVDGEVDIAICRVDDQVYYYYGQRTADPGKNLWFPQTSASVAHALGAGPIEIGLTATGQAPEFKVAGHFNWVVIETGAYGDGCGGALERFSLPEDS